MPDLLKQNLRSIRKKGQTFYSKRSEVLLKKVRGIAQKGLRFFHKRSDLFGRGLLQASALSAGRRLKGAGGRKGPGGIRSGTAPGRELPSRSATGPHGSGDESSNASRNETQTPPPGGGEKKKFFLCATHVHRCKGRRREKVPYPFAKGNFISSPGKKLQIPFFGAILTIDRCAVSRSLPF